MGKWKTPLLILSIVLMLFTTFGYWLSSTLYNPQKFNDIVVKVYQESQVRDAIASEITDATLQNVRPAVKQVVTDPVQKAISGILASNMFTTLFEKAATRVHSYLTSDNRKDVTLEVGQVAVFVKSAAIAISPDLGNQIPSVTPRTITLVNASSLPNLNAWLKPIMAFAPLAGFFSILILIYLFFTAGDKARYLTEVGIYFVIGIFIFSLLIPYVRVLLQSNISNQNAEVIATQTYNAFAGILLNQLLFLASIFAAIFLGGYLWDFWCQKKGEETNVNKGKEVNKNGSRV